MIDADHFKKVNDEHGHAVGDQALNHLTRIIQDNLRQTDLLARYGGEELVVLMPGTLLAHAHLVAERARALVESTVLTLDDEKHLPITVSIGLAEWLPGESLELLLERADQQMYRAKQQGRNRVVSQA